MKRRQPRSYSLVALSAIVVAAAVFAVAELYPLPLRTFWALRPSLLSAAFERGPSAFDLTVVGPVWLSTLVHSDVMHLASNMVFLWFFGALLAQVAGERWVFAALLLTPIGSAAATMLHLGGGGGAIVGASGAISGLSGLYVLLSFRWEAPDVYTWPLSRPVRPAQAAVVAVISAGLDIYVMQSGVADGVARDAHLGGFAAGLLVGALLTTFFPTREAFAASPLGPSLRPGGEQA